jgi:hypothetical protein
VHRARAGLRKRVTVSPTRLGSLCKGVWVSMAKVKVCREYRLTRRNSGFNNSYSSNKMQKRQPMKAGEDRINKVQTHRLPKELKKSAMW